MLAIDTATPAITAGIVALDDGAPRTLAQRVTVNARAHGELLTPQVQQALAEADIQLGGLDAIVVRRRSRPVHRPARRHGHRGRVRRRARHPGAPGLLAGRDRRRRHRHRTLRGGHRRAAPRGLLGRLRPDRRTPRRPVRRPARPRSWTGSPNSASAPSPGKAQRSTPTCSASRSPNPRTRRRSGLVSAASNALRTGATPAPLTPLYLRRPDAMEAVPRKQVSRL